MLKGSHLEEKADLICAVLLCTPYNVKLVQVYIIGTWKKVNMCQCNKWILAEMLLSVL